MAVALTLCGALHRVGGAHRRLPRHGRAVAAPRAAYWPGFAWVSAGLLANAALITTIGFILSCTLCYVLAVQGLRRAAGQAAGIAAHAGSSTSSPASLISAPVFWMFTKFLAINLPGLTIDRVDLTWTSSTH